MAITTDMSDYEIETGSVEVAYDDEILCAGWVPEVELASQCLTEPYDRYAGMPADLTTEIPDLFLRKMYSYQE